MQKNNYTKIKNVLPNINLCNIYKTFGLAILMLVPIFISAFFTVIPAIQSYRIYPPYDVTKIFNVLVSEFIYTPLPLKILYILLLVLFCVFIYLAINKIKIYKAETLKVYNSEKFISYITFTDNNLYLAFPKNGEIREISYNDIDCMKLSLTADTQYSKYGSKK